MYKETLSSEAAQSFLLPGEKITSERYQDDGTWWVEVSDDSGNVYEIKVTSNGEIVDMGREFTVDDL